MRPVPAEEDPMVEIDESFPELDFSEPSATDTWDDDWEIENDEPILFDGPDVLDIITHSGKGAFEGEIRS